MHAELGYGDNMLMLASVMPDRQMTGAEINPPLETKSYGDRMYGAGDQEGHQWYFATHVKDVAPEDRVPPG